MKRLIFCFDGTWNKVTEGYPTNVSKIAHSVKSSGKNRNDEYIPQLIYYDEGVGTHELGEHVGVIVNKISGALGFGLQQNVVEAYTHLILNYELGDEIYVFGFSRGAFTARSFVGMLRNCGILTKRRLFNIREAVDRYINREEHDHPNSHDCCAFRYENNPNLLLPGDQKWRELNKLQFDGPTIDLKIKYLGVWDTVGALGVPENFGIAAAINEKYTFHDTKLSKFVESARHAVAADERRNTFKPSLWTNLESLNDGLDGIPYQQKVFPGTHSAIGGGGPVTGLSDMTLEWVFRGAQKAGLDFDTDIGSPIYGILPNHGDPLFNEEDKIDWDYKDIFVGSGLSDRNFGAITIDQIDDSIFRRWHDQKMKDTPDGAYRPESLSEYHEYIQNNPPKLNMNLDEEIFDGITHADRELRQPKVVEKYIVQAQDTWKSIAYDMYGTEAYWKLLFIFNFNHGVVYDPWILHATRTILIPKY